MRVNLQCIWGMIVAVTVLMRVVVDVYTGREATLDACAVLFTVLSETKDRLPRVSRRRDGGEADGRVVLAMKARLNARHCTTNVDQATLGSEREGEGVREGRGREGVRRTLVQWLICSVLR